jgi:hypothetical protein
VEIREDYFTTSNNEKSTLPPRRNEINMTTSAINKEEEFYNVIDYNKEILNFNTFANNKDEEEDWNLVDKEYI